MKKIEITVPNEVVATIVSLVMDYVTELHVTEVEAGEPTPSPVKVVRAKREKRVSPTSATRLGKIYLESLPENGVPIPRSTVAFNMEAKGYKPSGESSTASGLVKEGLIEVLGTGVRKVVEGNT